MFHIIDELFRLSQKADRIIEKAFSNQDLDAKFIYAKNTMQEIMNGNFPKYNISPWTEREKNRAKYILRYSDGAILENKPYILAKNSLSPVTQSIESNDSGVVIVSSSDIEENFMLKREINSKEFDESKETHKAKISSIRESETTMFEKCNDVASASNSENKISSLRKSPETITCNEKALDLYVQKPIHKEAYDDKIKEFINMTPKNCKIAFDFEDILHEKRRTRSVTKNYCKKGISLDGSFHEPVSVLDNANRTYVKSSTSCEGNIFNRTYVISSTSSEESNAHTIILRDSNEDAEVSTPSIILKDKSKSVRNDMCSEDNMPIIDERLIPDEVLFSMQNKSSNAAEIKNHSGSSEENVPGVADLKYENLFEKISKEIKCFRMESLKNRKNDNKVKNDKKMPSDFQKNYRNANTICAAKNFILENSSHSKSSAQNIDKHPTSPEHADKHRFSYNSSSDDAIPELKKRKLKNNTKKLCQTNSAPPCRKQFKKRICRPATPVEFISDYKRQSLKDKAEEKRKHREIRVQKAKERRERFQREKQEKNRLNEQRLKQRFEQHEKMLRQKVNKFRIQLRSQQQWNARGYRSSTSTSSKDSKEGKAEDNDVCRNAEESGQQLSKVGNSYRDMPLKKDAPNSLLGNVGRNPETAKKHNSIVTCDETPVDFPSYIDGRDPETAKIITVCENAIRTKDNEELKSKEQPHSSKVFSINSSSKISNTLCHLEESDVIRSGQKSKRSSGKLSKSDSEIYQLKDEDSKVLSEGMPIKEDLKEPTYYLRSAQNNYSYNTPISAKTEKLNHNGEDKKSCETLCVAPSSDNESCGCSYSCFNSSKPKKNLRINRKSLAKRKISAQTGKKKRCLKDSNPGIIKKKNSKKAPKNKENVTSYKISDMHENSFDEAKVDYSKIPLWATGLYLKQALIQQYYKPPNVEKIFGTISDEPIDLAAIFQMDKPEYHRRTSSVRWSATETPP